MFHALHKGGLLLRIQKEKTKRILRKNAHKIDGTIEDLEQFE